MDNCALMSISPLDGRYREKLTPLREIFSEYGLIKYRIIVEVTWLEALTECPGIAEVKPLSKEAKKILHDIVDQFSLQDALRVKEIEAGINHDVKAVEYFIKEKIATHATLKPLIELIHFGCTSEDINNLAYGLMLVEARKQYLLPLLDTLIAALQKFAHDHADIAMLARTHGQPATPTTVGKEIANVIARLKRQFTQLSNVELLGKMNGASGNYNAVAISYPTVDWQTLSQNFVTTLGLTWNPYTTQIEPHDSMAELFAILLRINTILIDFNRDVWAYIAINYFQQKSVSNEVGSSTMPHKVNPIDFENSEGNLGVANALFEHMIAKLPISRWQRDLSDSTVLRNMGVAIGHSLLAYQSTLKGIQKIAPNPAVIENDLDQHWEVLAEAIQTIMRRHQIEEPYEKLKAFTRGKKINQENIHAFIQSLSLPDAVKQELLNLKPRDYIGYASKLARQI